MSQIRDELELKIGEVTQKGVEMGTLSKKEMQMLEKWANEVKTKEAEMEGLKLDLKLLKRKQGKSLAGFLWLTCQN